MMRGGPAIEAKVLSPDGNLVVLAVRCDDPNLNP